MTRTQIFKAGKSIVIGMVYLLLTTGCKSEADRERDLYREQTKNICTSVLREPLCSEKSKTLAAKVLAGLSDKTIDPMPCLFHAYYHKKQDDKYFLALSMCDEDEDIEGLFIREKDSQDNVLIEEQYPYFIWYPAGSFKYIPFSRRQPGNAKDTTAWNEYQSGTSSQKYDRPPMFISIPQEGSVEVEIAVYDKKGNRSDYISLDSFLYRRPRGWANE